MRRRRRRHHPRPLGLRGRAERRRRHLQLVRHHAASRRRTPTRPPSRGLSVHELLTEKAATQAVGEHGLVALDWHSGNRSVLVDHELSGLVLGQTLATRPEDIYRALLEATAFGTRHDRRDLRGGRRPGRPSSSSPAACSRTSCSCRSTPTCVNLPLSTIGSEQGPALGSAIHAAVAAGAYPDSHAAAAAMGRVNRGVYPPIAGQRRRPTTRSTPSTAPCTTTSAAAPTRSCAGCAPPDGRAVA